MLADGVWTENHQKEKLFQDKKVRKKTVEAFLTNSLLSDEIDAALIHDAEVHVATTTRSRNSRLMKETRLNTALCAAPLPVASDFTDMHVFAEDADRCPELDRLAQTSGWHWSEVRV